VARAAEDAGADVLVEITDEASDYETHLKDGLLDVEGRLGSSRPEREEHIPAGPVERLGRTRQEEARSSKRVRRVGNDRVEAPQ